MLTRMKTRLREAETTQGHRAPRAGLGSKPTHSAYCHLAALLLTVGAVMQARRVSADPVSEKAKRRFRGIRTPVLGRAV